MLPYEKLEDVTVTLQVSIGNFHTYVGLLRYKKEEKWYDSPLVSVGIGVPASLLLFSGLILLCVCLYRKRKRGEESQENGANQLRDLVETGSRTAPPRVVRRAPFQKIQNFHSLHQVPDGGADEYLHPMQKQEPPGGVSQSPNCEAIAIPPPRVVERIAVKNVENDGYLHQVPDGGAEEYLQPVQE